MDTISHLVLYRALYIFHRSLKDVEVASTEFHMISKVNVQFCTVLCLLVYFGNVNSQNLGKIASVTLEIKMVTEKILRRWRHWFVIETHPPQQRTIQIKRDWTVACPDLSRPIHYSYQKSANSKAISFLHISTYPINRCRFYFPRCEFTFTSIRTDSKDSSFEVIYSMLNACP